MSERTTEAYEAARDAVAALMNARRSRDEIVFTRNSTEAINLVAHSYGRGVLKPGQAVLISAMEHHSNIVPWQMLRDAHGIELRVAPITDAGELDMAGLRGAAGGRQGRPGRRSPICPTCSAPTRRPNASSQLAHAHGAKVLFDGSQARRAPRASTCRRWMRFLRLHRPQALRPDRHRRAVGQGANCWRRCRPSWAAAT